MEPRATRPNEGMLFIYVEFLPMCSQRFMNKVRFANHQKGGCNCNYCTICIPVWVSISNSDWQISKHFQKIREIVVCTNEKKSDFHMGHAAIWFPHDPWGNHINLLWFDEFLTWLNEIEKINMYNMYYLFKYWINLSFKGMSPCVCKTFQELLASVFGLVFIIPRHLFCSLWDWEPSQSCLLRFLQKNGKIVC